MAADTGEDPPDDRRSPDRREPAPRDDEPVLPDVPEDERDVGWGEDRDRGVRDEEWYRRERPPHHE